MSNTEQVEAKTTIRVEVALSKIHSNRIVE